MTLYDFELNHFHRRLKSDIYTLERLNDIRYLLTKLQTDNDFDNKHAWLNLI